MYKVNINTNEYRPYKKISEKNWECGTINAFMSAINGWNTIEKDLESLKWRIELFCGRHNFEKESWMTWYERDVNTITYLDNYCGFERNSEVSPYGFKQGYFDIDKVIEDIEIYGSVKIPFKYVYDLRQYNKRFDGCYIEINKLKIESKINVIVELIKKVMLEDDYVSVNEYLYLQKTWDGKTSNSVCITMYDDTNIYVRITDEIKYVSMDSARYGDWEDCDIEDIYEYEDAIIEYLSNYLKSLTV